MNSTCAGCGAASSSPASLCASDGVQVGYRVCRDCGLMRQDPLWSADALAPYYSTAYYGCGQTKFPAWLEWVRQLGHRRAARRVCALLAGKGGAVLDIGCGNGAFLTQLQRLGVDIYGSELAGPAYDRAAQVPGIRLHQGVLSADTFAPAQFVAITLWHVFEHLPNPAQVLSYCRDWLAPGGRLIIEVPNLGSWEAKLFGTAWLHLDPPRHLYQFTPRALDQLLTRTGFEVLGRGTFSAQMGVFGSLQSLLNVFSRPRNCLYEFLLARGRNKASFAENCLAVVAGALLLPLAVAFAVVEGLFKRGAVLRYVCRRSPT